MARFQFCDNVVVATDAPPTEQAEFVEIVCGVLQEVWGLRVTCECIPILKHDVQGIAVIMFVRSWGTS